MDEVVRAELPITFSEALKAAARIEVLNLQHFLLDDANANQDELFVIYKDFMDTLPEADIPRTAKMKVFDTQYEEWFHKVGSLH